MELKLKPLIVLFKSTQSIENNVKVSLKDSILTINEFTAMEALHTKGELITQVLADKLLIPNSSLTYVLDVLEKRGYVTRRKDPCDRRRQLVTLTDVGTEVFKEIYAVHFDYMQEIFSVLSDEEQKQLEIMLKKLGKYAEEKLKDEVCD